MTAKWEKTGTNVGVLEVELPSEEFGAALDVAFKSVVKRVNVPGFRKGKVPRKIFEMKFGVESLYQDAVDYLLPRAYDVAVKETGIFPVDRPSVDYLQAEQGKPFVFKATVVVKPEVTLGEYKGLEIEDKKFEVTDESLQEELDNIRSSHAQIEVVEDGEVEKGDTVSIDFRGTVDGEPFEGGEAENFQLEIGSGMFIAGFEDQLIGMKPGETRTIQVTFPEEYHVKSLASKPAEFEVVLHDMKRKVLRELNDEFVQEISDFQTVDEFVADLKESLEKRAEADRERYLEDEAVTKATENAVIDLPEVMVEHEIDHQVDNFARQLQYQQIPLDAYLEFTGTSMEELRAQFKEGAEKRVRIELVLEEIAKQESLEPTPEDLQSELAKIAEQANMEIERVQQLMNLRDPGLQNMRHDLRNSRVAKFLVENSKLV
ncbi:trigger factor [Alicyclobacillus tolerans]|uniref:Trigger factor n=1 Tax=Alicyclobacillus tolerans TaxID=90970 RepID=A0A1M6UPG7_9BACL|nr:trigger factor [Alicyclobacillus montanus]SHK71084.1 trigger factor [Alicyclobacillus montanus]